MIVYPREEIVGLFRDFFVFPIFTTLAKKRLIDKFYSAPFSLDDFPSLVRKDLFEEILIYLDLLDLIQVIDKVGKLNIYDSSKFEKSIFKSMGSFALLYSYREMIQNIGNLLFDDNNPMPDRDRRDNVIDNVLTNGRKFFPPGLDLLKV
tara:strand:+ start:667 stop:1113 length:447 start_codon:yes stop_codon:yes gene_type:complete